VVINYANFLEENQYFEETFKVYERGITLFGYPIAFELWNTYLSKFLRRYGGSKIERTRDLFEQALTDCPPKFAKPIYLMYGNFEEEHGLARRAMNIYNRATENVESQDRFEVRLTLTLRKGISDSTVFSRCSKFWSQRQQQTSVSPPRESYTRRPSRFYPTSRLPRCVYASPLWSASLERSTEHALSTHMAVSSAILESIPSSGQNGMPSRLRLVRKIPSESISGSRELFKLR
jgi:tetratricopeptide (TPR) repeat protein